MIKKQAYTINQGLSLAKDYCSLQERCQKDVFSKLLDWGLNSNEADEVIGSLIIEGFINENRYSEYYAISKFNQNKWGKIKIKYALKQKEISDTCIKNALEKIDSEKYFEVCKMLAIKKWNSLKGEKDLGKKQKTTSYLSGKGFEFNIIKSIIDNITNIDDF